MNSLQQKYTNIFKLYKALETKALYDKTSGVETAKCCEVAANIAIDVLKMESEGIRAVKDLAAKNVKGQNILNHLDHRSHQSKENNGCDN